MGTMGCVFGPFGEAETGTWRAYAVRATVQHTWLIVKEVGNCCRRITALEGKRIRWSSTGETNVPEPAAALPGTACIYALLPSSRARVSALVCKKRKTKNMVPKREVGGR